MVPLVATESSLITEVWTSRLMSATTVFIALLKVLSIRTNVSSQGLRSQRRSQTSECKSSGSQRDETYPDVMYADGVFGYGLRICQSFIFAFKAARTPCSL